MSQPSQSAYPRRVKAPPSSVRVPLRPLRAGMLCLGLIASIAGCGSSDNGVASKSAGEILAAARMAAGSASSVRVVADSQIARGASLTLDASLAKDQAHAKVSLLGMNFEVIRDGDTLYVKGNQVFAARLGAVLGVKMPANTWLKGPAKGALAQTASFTDLETELPIILSGSGPIIKGANVKTDGQPAITLKETRQLYTGILYVATTGKPYPIQLVKHGRETGQTTFSGWNGPVTVTSPANAIDISELEHRAS
jgi:hypothetical protein